jgi:hypothetical protein
MNEEFPQEFFVPLTGEHFFEGRLTVNLLGQKYCVEIDLIQSESKKIWKHLTILYGLESKQEAIDHGMQKLAEMLKPSLH